MPSDKLNPGDVLIKSCYLSVDPALVSSIPNSCITVIQNKFLSLKLLVRVCEHIHIYSQRCMMNEDPGVTYLEGWKVDEPIIGLNGLGVVVQSNNDKFCVGDTVQAAMRWPWKKHFTQNIESNDRNWLKVSPHFICEYFVSSKCQ